jgi:SAM-dependent methyltransferase
MSITDAANAKMIEHWNGAGGRSWVARQQLQERLAAITDALFARAAVQPGERAIDIGCGTGVTTIDLLGFVGPNGRVLGVDISELMLARARERLGGDPRLILVQADATVYPFPEQSFDLALSRMGVMFFAEPAKSFANIRRGLRGAGRLTFACWRTLDENPGKRCLLVRSFPCYRCHRGLILTSRADSRSEPRLGFATYFLKLASRRSIWKGLIRSVTSRRLVVSTMR